MYRTASRLHLHLASITVTESTVRRYNTAGFWNLLILFRCRCPRTPRPYLHVHFVRILPNWIPHVCTSFTDSRLQRQAWSDSSQQVITTKLSHTSLRWYDKHHGVTITVLFCYMPTGHHSWSVTTHIWKQTELWRTTPVKPRSQAWHKFDTA